MANTIYKYTVPIDDRVHAFELPRPAEIVHVGTTTGDSWDHVQFWAVVEPGSEVAETRRRHFIVVGTGHPWPPGAWYKGTAIFPPFVWHLLEVEQS
jgi:hypothetical protein